MTIKGTQASVREITTLSTQPVDVQGEESDVVKSVSLQLPPDVSVIGSPNVTVTIRIEPAQGTVRFAVPAAVRGLGENLAVRGALPTVQVTLTGMLPDLLKLRPQDISVSLDLSGKNAYA
jgi:YbbR domain-containing protein